VGVKWCLDASSTSVPHVQNNTPGHLFQTTFDCSHTPYFDSHRPNNHYSHGRLCLMDGFTILCHVRWYFWFCHLPTSSLLHWLTIFHCLIFLWQLILHLHHLWCILKYTGISCACIFDSVGNYIFAFKSRITCFWKVRNITSKSGVIIWQSGVVYHKQKIALHRSYPSCFAGLKFMLWPYHGAYG
jgi:hypothetical protein